MSDLPACATMRLFLALWPDAAVRRALAQARDALPWRERGRPVPPAQLHLTLHFIGAVPAARVDALAAGLHAEPRRFELQLDRVEAWPRGLVVWCAQAVPAPLQQLHAELAQGLQRLALPVEARPLRPHVTLARRAALQGEPTLPPLVWPVAGWALVHSRPDRRYEVLRRWPA